MNDPSVKKPSFETLVKDHTGTKQLLWLSLLDQPHVSSQGDAMQMKKDDVKKFPKFAQYVSVAIPQLSTNSAIIAAIQKYSNAKRTAIRDALSWGRGPVIKIVAGLSAFGEFTPNSKSNEIRIQEAIVKQFESGKGLRRTAHGKFVYMVGATLLHELTHWADDLDGVDDPTEEGESFETAVYGKVIY